MADSKLSVFDDPDCCHGLTLAQSYAGAMLLAAQWLPANDAYRGDLATRLVRESLHNG